MAENKGWEENAKNWKERYPTADSQLELFCLKNGDIDRKEVATLLTQFQKFDSGKRGELDDTEALKLLEFRGSAKSLGELRAMVAELDRDKNHKLSFLEWSCAIFNRKWSALFDLSADPADVEKYAALKSTAEANLNTWTQNAASRAAEEKTAKQTAAKLAEETEQAKSKLAKIEADLKQLEEDDKKAKAADEEEMKKKSAQAGAKGRAAMFEAAPDTTSRDKEKIKKESHLKSEKKKAEKELADVSAKSEKAATDAKAAEAARAHADDEVKKYQLDVNAYASHLTACQKARDEKNKYEENRQRAESEAKSKADAEAKAKAEAKARLAAKTQAFSKN